MMMPPPVVAHPLKDSPNKNMRIRATKAFRTLKFICDLQMIG
jgi:hypothetical protein